MKSFEVSNKTLLGMLFIFLLLLKLLSGKAQPGSNFFTTAYPHYPTRTTPIYTEWNTGGTIATGNPTREFNRVFLIEASCNFIRIGSKLILLQGVPSRSSRPRLARYPCGLKS